MPIGLRIDVDTYRGTRAGVPELCRLLSAAGIRATFFFSVGPDNMGRHLWRLIKPAFLIKMLRSRAASLYGWDIILRGTCWPGPLIGKAWREIIRAAESEGHEMGLHAWDHYTWQTHLDQMTTAAIRSDLTRGFNALADILKAPPTCSAAPGWKCTETVLAVKEEFQFAFNSDCRGAGLFRPQAQGRLLSQPQVPVTLPTYDEVVGRDGITSETYNDFLLARLAPDRLNVLTIHAEAEGLACRNLFRDFLDKARALGHTFCPLGRLVAAQPSLPPGRLQRGHIAGREGWVAVQAPTE